MTSEKLELTKEVKAYLDKKFEEWLEEQENISTDDSDEDTQKDVLELESLKKSFENLPSRNLDEVHPGQKRKWTDQ